MPCRLRTVHGMHPAGLSTLKQAVVTMQELRRAWHAIRSACLQKGSLGVTPCCSRRHHRLYSCGGLAHGMRYGSEVWFPSTARQLQQIDKVQTDIIKCTMRCGKERPCSSILLAEWGVKPLHMWLHQRAMEFYFRVQRLQETRLPRMVFSAE
jgi:hypothetical protein